MTNTIGPAGVQRMFERGLSNGETEWIEQLQREYIAQQADVRAQFADHEWLTRAELATFTDMRPNSIFWATLHGLIPAPRVRDGVKIGTRKPWPIHSTARAVKVCMCP